MLNKRKKIAVIGAGLAGLTVAKALQEYAAVTLFEKARGVGGRMSTRYNDIYQFDHGAQFFTAKSPLFKNFLQHHLKKKTIQCWQGRFVEIRNKTIAREVLWDSQPPHFVGTPKMNALCKSMSNGLSIQLNTEIQQLQRDQQHWTLIDTFGQAYQGFDWIISTAPCEQSVSLFPEACFSNSIASIEMLPCFCLMLGLQHPIEMSWDMAIVKGEKISWIANNSSKPGRAAPAIVIHSTNAWAAENLATPIEIVEEKMLACAASLVSPDLLTAKLISTHRWKYANIGKQHGPPYYIDNSLQLAACGDWCIKGRVESAFLSAHALAAELQ